MTALLEREAELRLLDDVVDEVRAGRGGFLLVGGEAGSGKTSLVRELRRRSAGSAAFFVGACEPLSVPVPLAPLRELAEAAGAGDPLGAEGADPLRLARVVLAALSSHAPVVAVVEDAHWADPLTLDVVRLLARRLDDSGVGLLLTYRADEAAANAALEQLLGATARSPAVRRILLRPLSEAAVRELAEPAGVDAEHVARVTGGNPFLVSESIAAAARLPETVREAALARAGRLGADARAVVDAAAVIGRRMTPALLLAVEPGAGQAVDEALARGVLVAEDDLLGFRHELIRDAIESSLSPTRRAALHAQVFAALARLPGKADHARLAHHAERAGLVAEGCRYAAQAAAEAERIGALHEASLQAERALRLGAGLDARERFELLLQHSRTSNFASAQLEDAVESAESARSLAVELGDRVLEGRASLALTSALWSADRVVESKAEADAAVAVLDDAGDVVERARAHALRVRVEATTFDPRRALELAPASLAVAAEAGREGEVLDVRISTALARGHLGDAEALPLLAAAAAEGQAAGLTIQTVRAAVNVVYVAALLRRHEVVDGATADALRRFEDYQTTIPRNVVRFYRARSLVDRGRWAEARAILELPGVKLAAETPVAGAVRGLLALRAGDAAARGLVDAGWNAIGDLPETTRHATLRTVLVEAAWLRDDGVAALRQLHAAREAEVAARFARPGGDLAVWASRYGVELEPPPGAPAAVGLEVAGDWRGAVREWKRLDAPYDAALAALRGDERAAREALAALQALGATAAARAFARERARRGDRPLRGPRPSTAAHPAGLTRREQQVLQLLATGATNAGIAGSLHVAERTAAHHVAAILRKLGAPTRLAAVEAARARGLLAEDGQRDPRT